MEIQFYHLLTRPIEVALPQLIAKACDAGLRSVIKCQDAAQLKRLDEQLWTYDPNSFLPHGIAGNAEEKTQPILLSTELMRPNEATLLVIVDGTLPSAEQCEGFQRLADMFDGNDTQSVASARERWKHYKAADHTLSYYRQQENGGWKKEG